MACTQQPRSSPLMLFDFRFLYAPSCTSQLRLYLKNTNLLLSQNNLAPTACCVFSYSKPSSPKASKPRQLLWLFYKKDFTLIVICNCILSSPRLLGTKFVLLEYARSSPASGRRSTSVSSREAQIALQNDFGCRSRSSVGTVRSAGNTASVPHHPCFVGYDTQLHTHPHAHLLWDVVHNIGHTHHPHTLLFLCFCWWPHSHRATQCKPFVVKKFTPTDINTSGKMHVKSK